MNTVDLKHTLEDALASTTHTADLLTAAIAQLDADAIPAPPPPPIPAPPALTWPNAPSNYPLLTDQPFSPTLAPGWQLIWNDKGYGAIVDNPARIPGSSTFQVKYPNGFGAGSAPATQTYGLGNRKSIYVGLWWKANGNWQGHSSNVNKLQFLFAKDGSGDMFLALYGTPAGPFELRTALQFPGADTRSWLPPNAGQGIVTMGSWHRIEWLVEFNTATPNRSTVRFWLDGVLVGDYRDVLLPAGGFTEYKLSPTWGGMGGAKTQDDYFWFDHVNIRGL